MQLLVKMFIKGNISVYFFGIFSVFFVFDSSDVNCKSKGFTGLNGDKRKSVSV